VGDCGRNVGTLMNIAGAEQFNIVDIPLRTFGNFCVCKNEAEALHNYKEGDILVIPETSNDLLPLLKSAAAIITEREGKNSHAAVVGLTLDKPVIIGAPNATLLLKSGTAVTVDASRGIVFSGVEKLPVG
ncbi:MAG TPA: PEP-utilizing enzyme, partial [Clostridia bacterium]|nr:PEP-utilizing enzyme [Clostridia bacterium]